MTNYTLTTNQKELLKKGIAEEAAKDVRMHSGMEQETQQIFNNFINADTELMKQVSYNALLECCKYWEIYFSEGEAAAADYMKKKLQEQQEEIKAELALLRTKKMERLLDMVAAENF